MLRAKHCIALLIGLWLPLQGMAAVVMPFCKHSMLAGGYDAHATVHVAAQSAGDAALHHVHHGAAVQDEGCASELAPVVTPCDDCGHCALSGAYTLPVAGLDAFSVLTAVAPDFLSPALAGVVPHRLIRPPLLV